MLTNKKKGGEKTDLTYGHAIQIL